MGKIPIGVQLYSVREDCAKDLAGTIKAVAKMGYAGVEFAGYHNFTAPQIRKMLDDNNLKCCGTHIGLDKLLGDELPKTIEYHKAIGCRHLIVPWMPEDRRNTRAATTATAKVFNEIADKLKAHGMVTGYHTHDCDVKPIEGGVSAWEILADNTNTGVALQLDTANSMHGGADPIVLLKKYPGRAITVHLKEFSKTNAKVVLGEGDVQLQPFMAYCEDGAGTEWFIVEHETQGMPALESVDKCLQNLRKLGK